MRRAGATALAVIALALAACDSESGVRATRLDAVESDGNDSPDDTNAPDDTTGPDDTQPELPDPGSIEWGECNDDAVTEDELECATLEVPLDYSDPDGEQVALALVRAPATDDREGAILFNPGGPGGSGFDPIAYSGTFLQSELGLEHFDLVGFDPRGVDRSGGIRCVDDEYLDAHLYLDDTPDTDEEQRRLNEDRRGFDDKCTAKYGDTLRHYSTANTARDMDMIRAGIGDEQMSYIGISYGTYLGAVYATLFPERVRAMVLDSAFEPNGDSVEEQYLTQLVGFEEAFNNWATWCEGDPSCAFTAADVGAKWDALREELDANPVPGSDGRLGNQSVMDTATFAALYSEAEWPVLADALAKVEQDDADPLFALADDYAGREDDGTFNTLFQSIAVISCASGIEDQPPPDPQALLDEMREKAPRFSRDTTLEDLQYDGGSCDGLMDDQPVVEIAYDGDGPIVVVGGTNDPATPYRWAEEMAAELGPNARLVTFTGEGHGQLLANSCITDLEAALLADLDVPDEGATCNPDPEIERPSWWDDLPEPDGVSTAVSLPALDAALGLRPTEAYYETRLSDMSVDEVINAFESTMPQAGFPSLGQGDPDIDDTANTFFLTPDGDQIVVFVIGPDALLTDELSGAADAIPPGQTAVLIAYFADQ